MLKRKILFIGMAALLAGCGTSAKKARPIREKPVTHWGHFSGPVDTRWDNDGIHMHLLNELRYTDPKGEVWVAPAGSKVNGASIPKAFWSLIGGPFEGKYRNAAVLHDVAYERQDRPWQEVDLMFYHAMRCSGVGVVKAKTLYYALRRHGRHWDHPTKRATAAHETSARAERTSSVTPEEVNAIEEWIETSDPSLNQIEARAAGAGTR